MKSRKEKCGGKREVKKKGDSIKTERSEEKKECVEGRLRISNRYVI